MTGEVRLRTVLLGLLACALGFSASVGPAAAAPRRGAERFDVTGEATPTGGLRAHMAASASPQRLIVVSTPAGVPIRAGAVRVIENGHPVSGVTVSPAGSVAEESVHFDALAPPARGARDDLLVRYRSPVPLNAGEVELAVTIAGVGAVDLDYAARTGLQEGEHAASGPGAFWSGSGGLTAASAAAAVLILIALILVGPRRRTSVRERIAFFTHTPAEAPVDTPPVRAGGGVSPHLQRALARIPGWAGFAEAAAVADFERSPAELALLWLPASLAAAILVSLALGAVPLVVVLWPLSLAGLPLFVRHRAGRRRRDFADQLPLQLDELASAMRAGHGLAAALEAVTATAVEPSRSQWGQVVTDAQLGMSLETALSALARRMRCQDVEQVTLAAALHGRAGGNMSEVLDRVAESVRERADLRREMQALSGQARLSRWVVSLLPVILCLVMLVIDPGYMRPLLHTGTGVAALGFAAVLIALGWLAMRALTEIEV